MSFLDRLLGKQPVLTAASWPAMVLVPTGLNPMPDGENMFMQGFFIRDINTDEAISHRQLFELVPGSLIFKVAGTSFRQDALQLPAFAPGEPIQLIPEPKNRHDRNAVAVLDTTRRVHIGYVPRELAPVGARYWSSCHATCAYSWISPPRRSRRATLPAGAMNGGSADPSGGACPKARWGRWPL